MGQVFLAKNKSIDQLVAIKMINPGFSNNPLLRERFRHEAMMLSSLSHPNIVQFLNFVENDLGVFIIMEYVDGMTLEDFLTKKNGLIVEQKAFPMISRILDAFAYAHDHNVVHCDIKPSNILVTKEGDIKILDFGIAQILSETAGKNNLISGTLEYMSPEQVEGKNVDIKSDIYSLGLLFFQMLTGHPPYDSKNLSDLDIKKAIVGKPLERMKSFYPYISEEMQWFVDKATNKIPEERFNDCHIMNREVRKIRRKLSSGGGKRSPQKKKISLTLIFGIVSAAIITAGGILAYIYFAGNTEKMFADYIDVKGTVEGVGQIGNQGYDDAYNFKISYLNGHPSRMTFVSSSGEPAQIKDSILSRYKHVNTELFYDNKGNINHKYIYDNNGNLTHKIFFGENPYEATMQPVNNSSEGMSKLTYDAHSGRLASKHFVDKNGRPKSFRGIFGEKYSYDKNGRLTKVSYLDENGNPAQDITGVAYISFNYNRHLNETESSLYDLSGKPVATRQAAAPDKSSQHKKGAKNKENGRPAKNSPSDYDKLQKELFYK